MAKKTKAPAKQAIGWKYRERDYNTFTKSAWTFIGYAEYIRLAAECGMKRPDSYGGFIASSKERKRVTIEVVST